MYKKPNFFRSFFSFGGKIERGMFWSDIGVQIIGFFCVSVIVSIIVSVILPGDVAYLSSVVEKIVGIVGIFWLVHIVALTRRRLRDAGYSAKSYLWLLAPIIGPIAFIARLCADSKK